MEIAPRGFYYPLAIFSYTKALEKFPARRAQGSSEYTVEVRYSPALEPITVIHGAWTFHWPDWIVPLRCDWIVPPWHN